MTSLLAVAAFLFQPGYTQEPSEQRTVTVDRGVYDAVVSPDGSTVAFGLLGAIWLLPVAGGEARQLTSTGGWDHHPAWSPDGEHLAYVHDTPAASEAASQIVLLTLATGAARTLHGRSPASRPFSAVFSFGQLEFHPTNGRLYFVDFRSGIGSIGVQGEGVGEKLLPGAERLGRPGIAEGSTFAFGPDGDSLVVEMDTSDLWTQLHRTRLSSIELAEMTPPAKIKRTEVCWSPSMDSLVYLELSGGSERIAIQALGSGEVRRIELGPFNGRQLALFPDGERALVVSGRRLFSVDLESRALTPIAFEATLALPRRPARDLVITNARLFDATGSNVVERATVHVRDGKIAEIVTATESPAASTAIRVIDAEGRFLMPGLVDAHSHVVGITRFSLARIPPLGVTSVFDPGSHLPETLNVREAIDLGVLQGPRIYTSGPTIDGPKGRARPLTIANVTDTDDARSLIRSLADQGVDAIKTYAFLEPEITAAVIDEAHGRGLPVIGDLVETSWAFALDAGIDGFVHVMDHKWRFVSREPADPDDPWTVVDPDIERMDEFFARVAARGAMFDPTMMASSRYFDSDAFVAALHDGVGEPDGLHRVAVLTDLLGSMHRQGVRWVAGTDTDPGDLLDELAIYETMGIPNGVILQTATANVARWLRKDDFGTVEPGSRADLILVDGNPLERVRDLEKVVLVVQGGRVVVGG